MVLTVEPAAGDVDCCEVTLSGDAEGSFIVKPMRGGRRFDGPVTPGDASQVRFFFNQSATTAGPNWDFDVSRTVTIGDFA